MSPRGYPNKRDELHDAVDAEWRRAKDIHANECPRADVCTSYPDIVECLRRQLGFADCDECEGSDHP